MATPAESTAEIYLRLAKMGIDPTTVATQVDPADPNSLVTFLQAHGLDPTTADPTTLANVVHDMYYVVTPTGQLGSIPTIASLTKQIQDSRAPGTAAAQTAATNAILTGLQSSMSAYVTARATTTSTTEQTRQYVDIPTPQEFLDDFHTGMYTFLQTERAAGRLSNNSYDFLIEPRTGLEQLLLDEYTGHLGKMAASGQQVFDVVGTDPNVQPVGTRPGADTTRDTTGQTQETLSAGPPRTVSDTSQESLQQTENLFTRNKLGVVRSLSPMSWMTQMFAQPGAMDTWVQEQKGVRLRTYETEAAAPLAQPTRQQSLVS